MMRLKGRPLKGWSIERSSNPTTPRELKVRHSEVLPLLPKYPVSEIILLGKSARLVRTMALHVHSFYVRGKERERKETVNDPFMKYGDPQQVIGE